MECLKQSWRVSDSYYVYGEGVCYEGEKYLAGRHNTMNVIECMEQSMSDMFIKPLMG